MVLDCEPKLAKPCQHIAQSGKVTANFYANIHHSLNQYRKEPHSLNTEIFMIFVKLMPPFLACQSFCGNVVGQCIVAYKYSLSCTSITGLKSIPYSFTFLSLPPSQEAFLMG